MPLNAPPSRKTSISNGQVDTTCETPVQQTPDVTAERLAQTRQQFADQQASGKPAAAPQIQNLSDEFSGTLDSLGALMHLTLDEDKKARAKALHFQKDGGEVGPGDMQIGMVRLRVPPESIHVHEMPQNIEVPGLRTDGTTIIKTGRGRIQIAIDLVFEGQDQINVGLRELLAQFRSYPYVPIVNDHLARIVQPFIQKHLPKGSTEQIDNRLQEANAELINSKVAIQGIINDLLNEVQGLSAIVNANQTYLNAITAFFTEFENLTGIAHALRDVMDALRDSIRDLPASTQLDGRTRLNRAAEDIQKASEQAQRAVLSIHQLRATRAQLEIGGFVGTKDATPVCLEQIQIRTEDGFPRMLRAKLVVVFFNPLPYGGTLQWADILGNPTLEPHKATFMRTYLQERWLKDPYVPELPGDIFSQYKDPVDMFKYERVLPIVGLGSVRDGERHVDGVGHSNGALHPFLDDLRIAYATTTFEAIDPIQAQRVLGAGTDRGVIQTLLDQRQPVYRTLDLTQGSGKGPSPGVTIQSISVSMANRLALQPVQGEFYPSMQYVGAKPAYVSVSLLVTNPKVLEQIHAMKMANQKMSVLGTRGWRRPEVHIRNSIINLTGVYTAQIDDITTTTISPNTDQVVIRFVEHRIDLKQREAIRRSTLFSDLALTRALEFLFEKAKNYIDAAFNKSPRQRSQEELEALEAIGGDVDPLVQPTINLTELQNQLTDDEIADAPDAASRCAFLLLFGPKIDYNTDDDAQEDQGILHYDMLIKAFALNPLTSRDADIREEIAKRHFRGVVDEKQYKEEDQSFAGWASRFARAEGDAQLKIAGLAFLTAAASTTGVFSDAIPKQAVKEFNQFSEPLLPAARKRLNLDLFLRAAANQIRRNYSRGAQDPDRSELDLIAKHLGRSAANTSDELSIDPDAQTATVKDLKGNDKTASIRSMLVLAQAIINDSVPGLRDHVMGADTNIQDFLRNKQQYRSDLYSDLGLPTWGKLLRPVIRAIQRYRQGTVFPSLTARNQLPANFGTDANTVIKTVHEVRGAERELLKRYIPTYEDIGKIPSGMVPNENRCKNMQDFAYDFPDDVLPDFPYYAKKHTPGFIESEDLAKEGGAGGTSSFERARNPNTQRIEDTPHDALAQSTSQHELFRKETGSPEDPKATKRAPAPSLSTQNTESLTTEEYKADRDRLKLEDFKVGGPENYERILRATSALNENNQGRMQRAFPTIKVYFIEEDRELGQWTAIDDVYSYNSIISCTVTRHKYQADLAEISFTNLEGNLETDKFSQMINTTRDPVPKKKIRARNQQDRSAQSQSLSGLADAKDPLEPGTKELPLRKFPLSEGTRIAIKLGYHTRDEYLDTVFTGKISQVQMGDVVQVVAQSYLQELLYPMTENVGTEKSRGIVEAAMEVPSVEHFGRWTPFSWQGLSDQERNNSQTRLSTGLGLLAPQLATFAVHPKYRNVFFRKYRTWWSNTIDRLLFEENWEVGGGTKSAWDVIQEVTNFTPGYIAAVVPYDFEATLFIGRPEQPYFWTDGYRDTEAIWQANKLKTRQAATGAAAELLKRYRLSDAYNGDLPLGRHIWQVIRGEAEAYKTRYGDPTTENVSRYWESPVNKASAALGMITNQAFNHPVWSLWIDQAVPGLERFESQSLLGESTLGEQYRAFAALLLAESDDPSTAIERSVSIDETFRSKIADMQAARDSIGLQYRPAKDAVAILNLIRGDRGAAESAVRRVVLGILEGGFQTPLLDEFDFAELQRASKVGPGAQGGSDAALGAAFANAGRFFGNLGIDVSNAITGGNTKRFTEKRDPAAIEKEAVAATFTSGTQTLRNTTNFIELLERVWNGSELTRAHMRAAALATRTDLPTETANELGDLLYRYRMTIPVVLRSLRKYLEDNHLIAFSVGTQVENTIYPFNPRSKPFRQHHLVTSFDDLMENQMATSRSTMWNGVAIGSGGDPPQVIWLDDGITKGDRILKYFHEPNADLDMWNVTSESGVNGFVNNRFLVGFSRLAQGMRPMYRGQLILRGRPDIKPWDIINLYDTYNFIFGPVEVERITHHYSMETGFLTTVTPHAVAVPNNHVDSYSIMVKGWEYAGKATQVVGASAAVGLVAGAFIGLPVALALGIGATLGAKTISDAVLKEITGTGMVGNLMGAGQYGNMPTPVKIMPLMRQGLPWVAGLDGFGEYKDRSLGFVLERLVNTPANRLQKRVVYAGQAWDFMSELFRDAHNESLQSFSERVNRSYGGEQR
jgi:hypothetical protein